MSGTRTIDIANIEFGSTVFPDDADMRLWESLTPEEQRAVIVRDLDAAEAGGVAAPETPEEIIARVRARTARHDL